MSISKIVLIIKTFLCFFSSIHDGTTLLEGLKANKRDDSASCRFLNRWKIKF